MDGCECEFSSYFAESESLNEAPLIEATTESAPVCLKRPPGTPADPVWYLITGGYDVVFAAELLWSGSTRVRGPPAELAA